MKNIAIIPARGGSKRIPRKNIRNFLGKPIIAYSIEAALNSHLFDEVIVSTDDEEIGLIAQRYGAKVPFYRSEENSSDFATTADVIKEVLNTLENSNQIKNVCCIYATAPFVSPSILKTSFLKLNENNGTSLFPVCKFGFPPQRALIEKNNIVSMKSPEHLLSRSQDLEPMYHDTGQFYWLNREAFINENTLYTERSVFFEVEEISAQDIDNEIDWKIAELKYKLMNDESIN